MGAMGSHFSRSSQGFARPAASLSSYNLSFLGGKRDARRRGGERKGSP